MACNPLTAGYKLGSECKGQAGVKAVYLANYQSDLITTLGTDDEITALTVPVTSTLPTFYKIELKAEQASFETSMESANGMIKYTSTLTFPIQAMSAKILKLAKDINKGYYTVIVESVDGQYYIFGHSFAAEVTANSIATGTAMTDVKGSNITLVGISPDGHYFLTDDAFDELTIV